MKITYNLTQIDALRRKLVDDPLMWPYYNATPKGDDFACFVQDVGKLLGNTVDPQILETSCMPLLGKELTKTRLKVFALRIAANIQRLRSGEVILPWVSQGEEEWAPVEVVRSWPGRNRKGVIGSYFQFLVLAGTPVGLSVVRFWTQPQCNYVGIELGFSRRRKRPLIHPSYMVRLRFLALFEPKLSGEQPGFHKVRMTPGLTRYNGHFMKDRFHRAPGCPPRGYEHACHVCWLGYGNCVMAVHPLDYEQKICDHCATPKAWHDPADDMDCCINCANKVRFRPKETT
jgi:hypothetical protein